MLCETCRWTERPGFVRRPAKPDPGLTAPRDEAADFIPCPDCGGAGHRPLLRGFMRAAGCAWHVGASEAHRVAGSSPSKWPRCWSHASKASAGKLARAQMAKNHTQPVADAM